MPKNKFLGGFLTAISALSLSGGASSAQSFSSLEEAQAYLINNPNGSQARAAFRYIVENSLRDDFPEFSRSSLSDNFARNVRSGSGLSPADVQSAFGTPASTGTSQQY